MLIHGKEYSTVAERLQKLHQDHEGFSITTLLIEVDDKRVIMKATITLGDRAFTGHACEEWGASQINQTSALEVCETSAVGRALAMMGYAGTEIASAEEVKTAIHQQKGGVKEDKRPCTTSMLGLLYGALNHESTDPELKEEIAYALDHPEGQVTDKDIIRDQNKGLTDKDKGRGLTGPYEIMGQYHDQVVDFETAKKLIDKIIG